MTNRISSIFRKLRSIFLGASRLVSSHRYHEQLVQPFQRIGVYSIMKFCLQVMEHSLAQLAFPGKPNLFTDNRPAHSKPEVEADGKPRDRPRELLGHVLIENLTNSNAEVRRHRNTRVRKPKVKCQCHDHSPSDTLHVDKEKWVGLVSSRSGSAFARLIYR